MHWERDMTRQEYLARANECVRMAEGASAERRAQLLELANAWLKLAEGIAQVPTEPVDPPVKKEPSKS
jgi:hypothetical protein